MLRIEPALDGHKEDIEGVADDIDKDVGDVICIIAKDREEVLRGGMAATRIGAITPQTSVLKEGSHNSNFGQQGPSGS